MLAVKIMLRDLSERLQFDVRLQISLRSNAINIMEHYEAKQKFLDYISEREEKIMVLLNVTERPVIMDGDSQIFP